jgi:Amt family ammonium transporter
MDTVFRYCTKRVAEGLYKEVLKCVSDQLEEQAATHAATQAADLQQWLLVLAGALVFFMQVGFAMLCGGSVQKKNLQNTMLKNLLDACGAAIAFYSFGYAFAFGGQHDRTDITFVGVSNFYGSGEVDQAFWFFEYAFSAASTTIVVGALAERCQMGAYLCYSMFLAGFVYPVVVHSIWSNNGFLSAFSADPLWGIGCIDFAGAGVVHLTGGTTALIATYILGPREGRFYDDKGEPLAKPKPFPGHSIALQLMGTMILWVGCKYLDSTSINVCSSLSITLTHIFRFFQ